MERFVKGDVVVVPFPFSDLSTVKRRPALAVATPGGDDVILCQITSQQVRDRYAVGITDIDFTEGTLRKPSNVRPNRLFSASANLILYRAGHLNDRAVTSVIDRIIEILQAE
ncbi:type II toxin-antitoxin system PemK/MazF family toxin [uncultured Methanoculleus sp.]|uniref:Type II toxin-antitoxin system PemK/MazF family toxin n=1 Tax=Methanoculleus palmolei TaxID=72612 RepID=A0ABD8AAU3_9EURY|nr:type II toxin-antitoxin system PemK/MazF family toxin [Methanoculleus palmolei]